MTIPAVLFFTVALEEEVAIGHVVWRQVMREKTFDGFTLAIQKSRKRKNILMIGSVLYQVVYNIYFLQMATFSRL